MAHNPSPHPPKKKYVKWRREHLWLMILVQFTFCSFFRKWVKKKLCIAFFKERVIVAYISYIKDNSKKYIFFHVCQWSWKKYVEISYFLIAKLIRPFFCKKMLVFSQKIHWPLSTLSFDDTIYPHPIQYMVWKKLFFCQISVRQLW